MNFVVIYLSICICKLCLHRTCARVDFVAALLWFCYRSFEVFWFIFYHLLCFFVIMYLLYFIFAWFPSYTFYIFVMYSEKDAVDGYWLVNNIGSICLGLILFFFCSFGKCQFIDVHWVCWIWCTVMWVDLFQFYFIFFSFILFVRRIDEVCDKLVNILLRMIVASVSALIGWYEADNNCFILLWKLAKRLFRRIRFCTCIYSDYIDLWKFAFYKVV